jgi:hypothetical protein
LARFGYFLDLSVQSVQLVLSIRSVPLVLYLRQGLAVPLTRWVLFRYYYLQVPLRPYIPYFLKDPSDFLWVLWFLFPAAP